MSSANKVSRSFSWSDYRSWGDSERWELIGGNSFAMSPSPSSRHQAVCGALHIPLFQHFKDRRCHPFFAPMDVKLSEKDVVQPDLLVVCDPSQIKPTHIEGPPTLVVEIVSPSSLRHDRVRKLQLYVAAGVQEYWLVRPYPAMVEVLSLDGGSYRVAGVYTDTDRLRSSAFPELVIDLTEVFTMPVPPEEQIDEIRESAPPYLTETTTHTGQPTDRVLESTPSDR